jgi:hypothetical protein
MKNHFTLDVEGQAFAIGRLTRDALVAAGLVYRDDDTRDLYHAIGASLSDCRAAVLQ